MAMEDLLRIAERTEDLPDQALAQIAASGSGIESVIAASEMKARSDIREDAQMMQNQAQPPVVDQLINMAMRQPTPPMGAPMPPQMGMQQPMPQPAPPQMAPDMAQLAQQMGVPAMNTGGLIRRFQAGRTVGESNLDQFMLAQQQLADVGFTPEEFERLTTDQRRQVMQQIEDQKAFKDVAALGIGAPIAAATDAAFAIPRAIDAGLSQAANTRLGKALGFSGPLDTPSRQPFDASQQRLLEYRETLRPTTLPRFEATLGTGEAPDVTSRRMGPAPFGVLPEDAIERPSIPVEEREPARAPTLEEMLGPEKFEEYQRQNQKTAEVQASKRDGRIGPSAATSQVATNQANNQSQAARALTGEEILQQTNIVPRPTLSPLILQQAGLSASGALVGSTPSSESKTISNLNNKLYQQLLDRERKHKEEVDSALREMKELEADLPTRENIKDRIKKQTSLGMAQAFFEAAGSGSPDFLTAISAGFGGAAGVMNKMTGEEQKELYQHALQRFAIEKGKADTAYKRQQDALNQIQAARQYEQTYANNKANTQLAVLEYQRKFSKDALDSLKGNEAALAERLKAKNDAIRAGVKDFQDQLNANRNLDAELYAPREEHNLRDAVDYAIMEVPQAQRLVNTGIRTVISDMRKIANGLSTEERQLSPAQQEAIIRTRLEDSYTKGDEGPLIGKLEILEMFSGELFSIYGSKGKDNFNAVIQQFQQKYPYIDTKVFTDNTAPIL